MPAQAKSFSKFRRLRQCWEPQSNLSSCMCLMISKRRIEAAARSGAGAIMTTEDAIQISHRARVVELANKQGIPVASEFGEFARTGALMSYGPNILDSFRNAASYVDKILKGAKPADLPVEQPTRFELVINLKTANAIGLTVPQSILARADEVIE